MQKNLSDTKLKNILKNSNETHYFGHLQLNNWKKEADLPPPSVKLFLTKLLNSEKRFPSGNTKQMIESYGYEFSSWRNERRDHDT